MSMGFSVLSMTILSQPSGAPNLAPQEPSECNHTASHQVNTSLTLRYLPVMVTSHQISPSAAPNSTTSSATNAFNAMVKSLTTDSHAAEAIITLTIHKPPPTVYRYRLDPAPPCASTQYSKYAVHREPCSTFNPINACNHQVTAAILL